MPEIAAPTSQARAEIAELRAAKGAAEGKLAAALTQLADYKRRFHQGKTDLSAAAARARYQRFVRSRSAARRWGTNLA